MNENTYTKNLTGVESFEFYKPKKEYIVYNYRHTDGAQFSCIEQSVAACRTRRDAWIRESYLLATNQIVYELITEEGYLVLNTNLKGHIILINLKSAKAVRVLRVRFFYKFKLNVDSLMPEIMDKEESYLLMLQAYTILNKIIEKEKQQY
ncbi:DUF3873 family protein [Dysgonomonas sp. ZJ709]|uniref:DUF3873 family protein n=1 Tax=Dysgonomonas sp. ZJ709 TaxID=2709797 RepID=UPI0013ED5951|nr:DUF3873 family protein [Dysgonomonas sp. ZJ709]